MKAISRVPLILASMALGLAIGYGMGASDQPATAAQAPAECAGAIDALAPEPLGTLRFLIDVYGAYLHGHGTPHLHNTVADFGRRVGAVLRLPEPGSAAATEELFRVVDACRAAL